MQCIINYNYNFYDAEYNIKYNRTNNRISYFLCSCINMMMIALCKRQNKSLQVLDKNFL